MWNLQEKLAGINVRNATATHYRLAWLLLPFCQEAEDVAGARLI